jgi:hypothetical protein
MHQIQVQVLEFQIGERLTAGRDHIRLVVLVVPEFRSDPEFLTGYSALDGFSQDRTNAVLVAIYRGTIDVPVAPLDGALDSLRNFAGAGVVGSEGPKTDSRHAGAGVETALRHRSGVHGIDGTNHLSQR